MLVMQMEPAECDLGSPQSGSIDPGVTPADPEPGQWAFTRPWISFFLLLVTGRPIVSDV